MILIGRDLSPFVRRCVVSLRTLGVPFERRELSTADDAAAIAGIIPLGRVPALQLDDGEVLVDSGAILDWLDQEVGPARALTPPAGPERRAVLRSVALACGAAEKAVQATYERRMRPAEKLHQPWLDRLEGQVAGGLAALEAALAGNTWFHSEAMTQADISAVCAYQFVGVMCPHLLDRDGTPRFPDLAALSDRCDALPAFAETSLEKFRG